MKNIAILGSTGSIGRQTLDVVESLAGRFRVVSLAAGNNVELVAEQVKKHKPELVSVANADGAAELRERLRTTLGAGERQPEIQHGAADAAGKENGVDRRTEAGRWQADIVRDFKGISDPLRVKKSG